MTSGFHYLRRNYWNTKRHYLVEGAASDARTICHKLRQHYSRLQSRVELIQKCLVHSSGTRTVIVR